MEPLAISAPVSPLLRGGETCWRLAHADRAAFLVDGEICFGAIAEALENAQERIWLIGWDFHSAMRLRHDSRTGRPDELVDLLECLVRERPALEVNVLDWDFSLLYSLEREFLPLLQFGARTHRRIHFATDSTHPATGSQHQKLVVIDDAVAFAGGFDLTTHRWDTREHAPDDPRRVTPSGEHYAPFHDVQMIVDGEAAAALAALARERWLRATGEEVKPASARSDPWPARLEPHVREVAIGIARTLPSYQGGPEIREVEELYRASIAAARRWIYAEHQYVTSEPIADWLCARLREPEGPEIAIVGPRRNVGWLEDGTMGVLRDRVVRKLREADAHGRLRVLYPHREGLPDGQIVNVHSKVMVVDDELIRIGSSNLSCRSLGLDSECDLALEANGRASVGAAIARFRNDLLAEHLGAKAEQVAAGLERTGSLVRTLDELGSAERGLRPLELEASPWLGDALESIGAIDPEHPVPLEELVRCFGAESAPPARSRARSWLRIAWLALPLVALAVAWQTTPLAGWISVERLTEGLAFFRESWLGSLAALGLFVLAALFLVPVTLLTVASGLALGPLEGVGVAWIGCTASAVLGYFAGRRRWRESLRRLAGARLHSLSTRLARRGVLSCAFLRILPIAPFMVVNLVAGASHVRARDFALGTALGVLPGSVLLAVGADRIEALLATPGGPAWLWLAIALLALYGVVTGFRSLLANRRAP